MADGYSTDVLVHAFAGTAREVGISTDLTRPFFASMRADLDTGEHDAASLAAYVYGSAEVVGLMCLRVFLHDLPPAERRRRYAELAPGARALGAAFQKVNFLRDLADDDGVLGRNYLGIDPAHVGEAQKDAVLADIEADLAVARTALRELPPGPRRAVAVAYGAVRRADRADPGDPGRRAGHDPGPGARPGQGADRGHRRAAGVGGRAMRTVVIGGGVAGLASAALLAREGHEVTVLEARDEVGGRASVWQSDGFRFDIGPSWYLMPEVFDHFFALMGTSTAAELDLVRLDPAYRAFFERFDPLDVRTGVAEATALFESVEPGAGRALERYLDSASDAYRMALRHFLYTTFASLLPLANREVLRRAPQLAGLLARSLESRVHATVRDTRLRQVLGYPAVFLGASPRVAPSMFHLMSHLDLVDGVRYPQGGFGEVVTAIHRVAERAGVQVRTGCRATSVTTTSIGRLPRVEPGQRELAAPLARAPGAGDGRGVHRAGRARAPGRRPGGRGHGPGGDRAAPPARSACARTRRAGGAGRCPGRAPSWCTWACAASCPSSRTTRCSSPTTGTARST